MTIYLRQSTASQEVPLGHFLDSTDGDTAETALTIANTDIQVWKTGATSLANKNSGGGTHMAGGVYYATLDATDTDTIGPLTLFCHVSGALAVKVDCVVLDEAVYDVMFGTTAPSTYAGGAVASVTGAVGSVTTVSDKTGYSLAADQAVNATKIGGTTQTGRDLGASVLLSPGTGTGQLDITSGVVKANLAQILGTALTETSGYIAAAFKQFFNVASPTGTMKAITNVVTTTTATNLTNLPAAAATAAELAKVPKSDGSASWNSTALAAINAEVDTALNTAIPGSPTANSVNERIATMDGLLLGTVAAGTHVAQSGDSYARIGAPAGASVSADVAAVKAQTAAIETDTQDLQTQVGTAGAGLTAIGDTRLANLDATVSSRLATAGYTAPLDAAGHRAALGMASADLDAQLDAIVADTGELQTNQGNWLTADTSGLATSAALATVDGIVDDILVDTGTTLPGTLATIAGYVDTEVAAIKAKTDNLPAAPAATGDIPTAAAIRAEIDSNSTVLASLSGYAILTYNNTVLLGTQLGAWTGTGVNTVLGAFKALFRKDASAPSDIGGTFDPATDSVEALRDRGDAAWITATGFSTLDAAGVRTAVGLASANLDTQLAALPTDSDVQTAATAALNAYDPPTKAELDAAVAPLATAAALDAVDNYVDTEVAAIKAVTDKLDTAVELDGAVYRYTANALEQAPTGGSAPSAADIRAEIDSNSTQLAAIVADTNELQTNQGNWLTADTSALATSAALAVVDGNVDDILVDTGTTLPASIAALPTDADVQTAATAALNAYDPPTNAEMVARTLAAAAYFDPAADTVAHVTLVDTTTTNTDMVAAAPSAATIAAAVEAAILDEGDATALLAAIAAKVEDFLINDGDATATLAAIATAVRSELTTELGRIDVAVSTRNATTPPTVAAIRSEMDANSAQLAAIVADTGELQTNQGNWLTATGFATPTNITAASGIALTGAYDAAKTAATQTSVDDIPTSSEFAMMLAAADDDTLAAIALLNNLSSAQAQSAAAAALTAYDPPTNAEMVARTLLAADYTVVSDLGTVQTGDSYARLGAPVGASVSADIAAVASAVASVGAGDGAGFYTDTVESPTGTPLDGVRVVLATDEDGDIPAYEARTDAFGVFAMRPDPGTYYLFIEAAGHDFTQGTEVTVVEP